MLQDDELGKNDELEIDLGKVAKLFKGKKKEEKEVVKEEKREEKKKKNEK